MIAENYNQQQELENYQSQSDFKNSDINRRNKIDGYVNRTMKTA